MRGGDIKQWLGKQAVETIEQQQRSDLLIKLGAEFSTMRQFFVDSPSPNWMAAFIPVSQQQEMQQARLFIKKDADEANKENQSGGTRFIMEVDLSHFGLMQFDGLVKKNAQQKQFDLIVRSFTPLPNDDQQAIRDIYTNSAEITGFTGGLMFQVSRPFPINPMREIIEHDRDVIA